MTIRAVLDTNVVLSGLFWHGTPHALLDRVREGTLIFISSPALLAELAEVIARPKYDAILVRSNTSRERSLVEVRELMEVIAPPPLAPRLRNTRSFPIASMTACARPRLRTKVTAEWIRWRDTGNARHI
jgi:putative PIN family toxin of toxin-antitoxin system